VVAVGVKHSAKHVTKQIEDLRVSLRMARHQEICTLKTEYKILKLLKDRDIQTEVKNNCVVFLKNVNVLPANDRLLLSK